MQDTSSVPTGDRPLSAGTPAFHDFPLRDMKLHSIIRPSSQLTALSPMVECTVGTSRATMQPSPAHSWTSPAHSWASAASLDSIISLSNRSPEEEELDDLIYRLCHSLYKVARKKSMQIHRRHNGAAPPCAGENEDVEKGQFSNMRGHQDWCPLLHLFDPRSYYRAMGTASPHIGCLHCGESFRPQSGPDSVSQWLAEELNVTRLAGGNSNHVYRLAHTSFPEKAVLLRVYGDGGASEVIDRARDTKAMRVMSKAGMGPALLHSFHWGRVEEFIDASTTCTTEKLLGSPALLSDIYEGICQMHQLDYTPFLPEAMDADEARASRSMYGSVEDMEPVLREREGYYSTLTQVKALESVCRTSFERACLRLLRLMSPNVVKEHRRSVVDWFVGEVVLVQRELRSRNVPAVLSHNDLNPGNILLPREASDMNASGRTNGATARGANLVERRGYLFIDFEYTDVNYRCFDLGNTLCELDYDYTRGVEAGGRGFVKYLFMFPPAEKAEAWRDLGEEYPRMPELIVEAWRTTTCDGVMDIGTSALLAVRRYYATRDGVSVDDVHLSEAQVVEVLLGMLASHLHWALWSIVMACTQGEASTCDNGAEREFAVGGSGLDYMQYGDCRLHEYIALRSWLADRGFLAHA
ncbi:putative Phosphotransferase enzyme family Choline ethanolamine kinase [Trypanosoma vivax]|nr:putative Phosphotransferase enzyme family Choline ethanolamine kinase [Trypanosoma vivax]